MHQWFSDHAIIYLVGFIAQLLFSARLLVQWILSEKVKKVLTPELFWQLSLLASFLFFIYGWLRDDFAIMFGQTITYFIYIRNMQIQKTWQKLSIFLRVFLWLFPALILFYSYSNGQSDIQRLFFNQSIPMWLIVWGSIAQIVFTFRFIYQWIYSEKIKRSHLPIGFWLLSLAGSLMILTYAIIRKDPILFLGQLFGSVIYIRNIIISRKESR
ncbi:lipid-A-disaccharide synthase N-terminal domain-containing protein [Sulfurovum sp. zt1-1]|uniref:Lipid-A-disaccharide synthase N-terminal domain-containing protein n=1 Tax=Sulfurovum zhangzhouensis TaxID=3019067 RepID=A0ABT7QYE3_9BACT|nr:lipid-A-disaccharide synthase N-terminal domain-containing protein [Sulfurovum zhangzhouensis]MDM5271847.1 lipid-A-disaccharide synthase N-terminal domain-containing protein [Sulfurovum zhangzhouensis]